MEYKNIWVFAEQNEKNLAGVSLELLAKAKDLSIKEGNKVVAVLLGYDVEELANQLLEHGAEQVIKVEAPSLKEYKPVPYSSVLFNLVNKYKPSIFLFGATILGRDLAPRLQAKLLTGLTSDCLDLDIDENGVLVQIKPSYGDNIMCRIICPDARPQMATVRPKIFTPLEKKPNPEGQIISETIEVPDDDKYIVIGRTEPESSSGGVAEAERLICIGRGACSEESIRIAKELAHELDAKLGVSRPLTDSGQFTHDSQVGQSGITVKPKCILNFGISGAVQYTVGMQNSALIISINKNEDATIFGISHYGYVGDATELATALLNAVRMYKNK